MLLASFLLGGFLGLAFFGGLFGLGLGSNLLGRLFCRAFCNRLLRCRLGGRFGHRLLIRIIVCDDQFFLFGFHDFIGIAGLLFFQRRQLRLIVEMILFEIHSILPWEKLARRIGAGH